MKREPNTIYTLSLSYGKDSLACLGAIQELGLPLDRIVHAEVWATDTIPADLPPMVEFKAKADKIIKERCGIEVEHVFATKKNGGGCCLTSGCLTSKPKQSSMEHTSTVSQNSKVLGVQENLNKTCLQKLTYEDIFYRTLKPRGGGVRHSYGFPLRTGQWCNNLLKVNALNYGIRKQVGAVLYGGTQTSNTPPKEYVVSQYQSIGGIGVPNSKKEFSSSPKTTGGINIVQYLGIASDEPERIERHEKKKGIMLPLVMAGWDEAYCRKWCEERDLLSPIYTTATRGGCWFCHNQGVGQLRLLRKNYPHLWSLLMKWDLDSPTTFKADGHTVHDYDKRFELEDEGVISADEPFYWKYLVEPPKERQLNLFNFI